MTCPEQELGALYGLLDQQVEAYRLIIEELKKQAECLRQGDTERLLEVIRSMGQQADTAHRLRRAVETLIEKNLAGGKDSDKSLNGFAARVSPADRNRVLWYGRTLEDLRARMSRLNERNKMFVREHLSFFSDLTRALIAPGAVSYPRTRRSTGPVPAFAFNREV